MESELMQNVNNGVLVATELRDKAPGFTVNRADLHTIYHHFIWL